MSRLNSPAKILLILILPALSIQSYLSTTELQNVEVLRMLRSSEKWKEIIYQDLKVKNQSQNLCHLQSSFCDLVKTKNKLKS